MSLHSQPYRSNACRSSSVTAPSGACATHHRSIAACHFFTLAAIFSSSLGYQLCSRTGRSSRISLTSDELLLDISQRFSDSRGKSTTSFCERECLVSVSRRVSDAHLRSQQSASCRCTSKSTGSSSSKFLSHCVLIFMSPSFSLLRFALEEHVVVDPHPSANIVILKSRRSRFSIY